MRRGSAKEQLSREEAASWGAFLAEVDRIPVERIEPTGAEAPGWTLRDVLFHLAAWCAEAAGQLAAVREGRYVEPEIDTDRRNEEYLRAGRMIDLGTARLELERAHARMLAEWAAMAEPPTPAMEWFAESGDEHYREHLADLRRWSSDLPGSGQAPQ